METVDGWKRDRSLNERLDWKERSTHMAFEACRGTILLFMPISALATYLALFPPPVFARPSRLVLFMLISQKILSYRLHHRVTIRC